MNRIKVLFIHGKLVCGGAEQALYDLLCLMDKNRFDITLFTLVEGGEWEEKFCNAGIRVESIWSCQRKSNNPWVKYENWQKRRKIGKAIKNNNAGLVAACFDSAFDIIVLYNVWTNQEIAFSGNAKTVKYIHGDLETNREYRECILDTIETVKKFDRIICVSNKAKTAFEKVTSITDNVTAYFNPLNSENIRALTMAENMIVDSERIICAVGRLAPEKGFERLIRVHKKLYDEGFKHKLVIVGEGPMRGLLEDVIRSIHCEESVILTGYTNNPYTYMKNSEFIVCSSYTEGLPVIAMEALSLGVPIVSAVPSIGELFGEEHCGIITENDDMGMEMGIRRMLSDQVFYQSAKAGAEKRSLYFDGKRMVHEIEREFMNLMNS